MTESAGTAAVPVQPEMAYPPIDPAYVPTQLAPPVSLPEEQRAWSAPNAIPDYRPPRDWWGMAKKVAGYATPAIVVALGMLLMQGSGQRINSTPIVQPQPAPVVHGWVPDHSRDDGYINALVNGGYEVRGVNSTDPTTPDRQSSLDNAYWSCTYLSEGHKTVDLVKHWDDQPGGPGVTQQMNHDDDVQWVNIMVGNLCPQFQGQ